MVVLVEVVILITVKAIALLLILILGKLSDDGSSILNTCRNGSNYIKKDALHCFSHLCF